MISQAGDLARRLARYAEAVCRHYLSNGRRRGRYWVIGDAMNTPGRSLYVRLTGPDSGPGAAGKWTDAASPSEHGDLLDLIRLNRNLNGLGEAMDEARRFLALPRPPIPSPMSLVICHQQQTASSEAARRLFRCRPAASRHAGRSLSARSRHHRTARLARLALPPVGLLPRRRTHAPLESWPALLAAVTDLDGNITGIQRTWLDPRRSDKAPLADPRRALGHLLGNGVRFGKARRHPRRRRRHRDHAGAQIGAALIACHCRALRQPPRRPRPAPLPAALRRLYVARDKDAAGLKAAERLHERGLAAGIEIRELVPVHGDFNLDLCRLGPEGMLAHLADQLVPSDRTRFLPDTRRSDPRR